MSSNNIENNQNEINSNLETAVKDTEIIKKENKLIKNKEKESIFSESSNENESNNNEQKFDNNNENNQEKSGNNNYNFGNKEEHNTNRILNEKINLDSLNSINNKYNNNNNNYNFNDNKFSNNNENEENISKSMSSFHSSHSNSNKSRSRSRSRSLNKSQNRNLEQNYDNFNAREARNTKKYGNKFQDYNNNRRERKNINKINNTDFIMKNGCCRDCMKAFSKNGKSCLCQVPRKERKFHLPENGCNYCGCKGCNPIDVKYFERMAQKNLLFKDKGINHKNQRILDSDDENLKIKEDDVDFYNMEKKEIQEDLNDVLKINSIFYGFGVPLRSPSYILGYNPNINYFYEKRINNNYVDLNNSNNNMNNNINNNMNINSNNMNNNANNYMNNKNYYFNNMDENNNNFKRNIYNNDHQNNNRNMKFNKDQRYRK